MPKPTNPCPDPAARNARILARYRAGDPVKAIACDERVSISLVSKVAQAAGDRRFPFVRRPRNKRTP